MLKEVSPQSHLMISAYNEIEEKSGIRVPLHFPNTDIDTASTALMSIIHGKKAGILYPYAEMNYVLLPLLPPLAHLHTGSSDHRFFVVASKTLDYSDVYRKICKERSGSTFLRFVHPFGVINQDGEFTSSATRRDSTAVARIAFWNAQNLDLPENIIPEIAGIVFDIDPTRRRLTGSDLSMLSTLLMEADFPIVVVYNNVLSPLTLLMKKAGVPIYRINRTDERSGETEKLLNEIITKEIDHDGFAFAYLSRSRKILLNPSMPELQFKSQGTGGKLKDLNSQLEKMILASRESNLQLVTKFLAYCSYVESVFRCLWTRLNDYDFEANLSFGTESLGGALERIRAGAIKINDIDMGLGERFLSFSEGMERCLHDLRTQHSAKAINLEKVIANKEESIQDSYYCCYSTPSQKATYRFLCGYEEDAIRNALITTRDLSHVVPRIRLILPGYPLSSQFGIFKSSSCQKIEIYCYEFERDVIKERLRRISKLEEELETSDASWHKDKISFNSPITAPMPKQNENKSDPQNGKSGKISAARPVSLDNIVKVKGIAEFIQTGEFPTYQLEIEDGTKALYSDEEEGEKWIVETDHGKLKVSSQRQLTVVYQTFTAFKTPHELTVGDILLVGKDMNPRPLAEYMWDLMAGRGFVREGAIWNEWLKKLRDYLQSTGRHYSEVYEILRGLGCPLKSPVTVYSWLQRPDAIGPRDRLSLVSIAKLIGATQEEADVWWASILQMRSILRSAYANVWKLAKYYASRMLEEDYKEDMLDGRLSIVMSDLSEYLDFVRVAGAHKLEGN